MRILITGINGFVGAHLESMLHKYLYHVSGLLRQNRSVRNENTQLHFINDLPNADFIGITCGYDIVVHLAALVHQPDQSDIDAYMRLNRDVTLALGKACIENGVSKFITLSTSHVYEGFQGDYLETQQLNPLSPYAKSKYQATNALLEISSGLSAYVIRPPLIYGKGVKGNLSILSSLIRRFSFTPFGMAKSARDYVSVTNLCNFIVYLIQNNVNPGVYNVSDNHDLSTKELCNLIARAQNKRIMQLPVPRSLMKLLFKAIGKQDHYDKIYGEFRLNIDKALATGWKPDPIDYKNFVL